MRMDALRQKARQLRNTATDAEIRLWHHLRLRRLGGCKFRRQVPLAGYIVDFVCLERKLIVELDDGQHLDLAARDLVRTRKLEAAGYRVLRYWNHEVLLRVADVLEDILRKLEVEKLEG